MLHEQWSILSRDTPLILVFATLFSASNMVSIRQPYYFDPVKSVAKRKIKCEKSIRGSLRTGVGHFAASLRVFAAVCPFEYRKDSGGNVGQERTSFLVLVQT